MRDEANDVYYSESKNGCELLFYNTENYDESWERPNPDKMEGFLYMMVINGQWGFWIKETDLKLNVEVPSIMDTGEGWGKGTNEEVMNITIRLENVHYAGDYNETIAACQDYLTGVYV